MIDFYYRPKPKRGRKLFGLILVALAAYAIISLFSGSSTPPAADDFLASLEDSLKARTAAAPETRLPARAAHTDAAPERPAAAVRTTATAPPDAPDGLLHASLHIRNSLTATLKSSSDITRYSRTTGLPRLAPMLVSHLQRPLVWRINLGTQIQKNDACAFVFRHVDKTEAAERKDIPDDIEVLAIRYYSLLLQDTLAAYHYHPSDVAFGSFYYADGSRVERQFDHRVIRDYIQVTAPFNENRGYRHQGIDFKAPVGTPVFAPFSGVVSRVNWIRKNNGNCLEITLDRQPYTVKYLHLDRIAVKRNQTVKAGQVVAYSGNTGRSYAPHLHYQVNVGRKGRAIDPMKFHQTHIEKLPQAEMPVFRKVVEEFDRLMLERDAAGSTT